MPSTDVPWPLARQLAHDAAQPSRVVSLPLSQALGATLADDLVALTALPPFDTVTMDGWAVCGRPPWRLLGRQLAGDPVTRVRPGQAVETATGAQLPRGADAVLRRERGTVEQQGADRWVLADASPGARHDVRPAGEEAGPGEVLLPRGTVVTPPVLGLAAAAGHDSLLVHPRPTVDVLVLGDELLTAGLPGDGRVRDSLGPQAPGWVSAAGAHLASLVAVRDEAEPTRDALAACSADLVVSTGGTARGPVDQVHPALRDLGAVLLVDRVAVRPGHPMVLARLGDGRLFVGLPGNPLAAAVAFASLAVPALQGSRGVGLPDLPSATSTKDLTAPEHAHRLLPARVVGDGARRLVTAVHHAGPAMLRGLSLATHLVVVPPGGAGSGSDLALVELPWVG